VGAFARETVMFCLHKNSPSQANSHEMAVTALATQLNTATITINTDMFM